MTQNQKTALQDANDKRSQEAAQARILKTLSEGKINRGQAVLLLVAQAGLYRYQAVNVVTEAE